MNIGKILGDPAIWRKTTTDFEANPWRTGTPDGGHELLFIDAQKTYIICPDNHSMATGARAVLQGTIETFWRPLYTYGTPSHKGLIEIRSNHSTNAVTIRLQNTQDTEWQDPVLWRPLYREVAPAPAPDPAVPEPTLLPDATLIPRELAKKHLNDRLVELGVPTSDELTKIEKEFIANAHPTLQPQPQLTSQPTQLADAHFSQEDVATMIDVLKELKGEFGDRMHTNYLMLLEKLQGHPVPPVEQPYEDFVASKVAPIDAEAIKRYSTLWIPILQGLHRLHKIMQLSRFDNAKKFVAYGKFPSDGNCIGYDPIQATMPVPTAFAPCTSPAVFNVLHALLGKVTELEETLAAFLTACSSFNNASMTVVEEVTMDNFDGVNVCEELGDDLFYSTFLANCFGTGLAAVIKANRDKLSKRYTTTFTPEEAVNRDLTTERTTLSKSFGFNGGKE